MYYKQFLKKVLSSSSSFNFLFFLPPSSYSPSLFFLPLWLFLLPPPPPTLPPPSSSSSFLFYILLLLLLLTFFLHPFMDHHNLDYFVHNICSPFCTTVTLFSTQRLKNTCKKRCLVFKKLVSTFSRRMLTWGVWCVLTLLLVMGNTLTHQRLLISGDFVVG